MSWVGLLRTAGVIARRYERDARRRRREIHAELEREAKDAHKRASARAAQLSVEDFENRIDLLTSLHRECFEAVDWHAARTTLAPDPEPAPSVAFVPSPAHRTEFARDQLANYRPSFFDWLLGRTARRRQHLADEVRIAEAQDAAELERERRRHEARTRQSATATSNALEEAAAARALADRVIGGDAEAWIDAIRELEPFSELSGLGGRVAIRARPGAVDAIVHVHDASVVPATALALTKTGKLSEKPMPRTRFVEVYQDYVCSAVLRVSRDLFAILPADVAYVTAVGLLLDTSTGEQQVRPIVSAKIPRTTLARLNFDALDPSDSMANFVHNMKLKRGVGFLEVDFVEGAELRP